MYAHPDFFFFRKPAGVASTRGEDLCFLTHLQNDSLISDQGIDDFPHMSEAFSDLSAVLGVMPGDGSVARQQLVEQFSPQEEYGLLNRLDTDTSGLLYFARTRHVYESYRAQQQAGNVEKYYLAEVWGEVKRNVAKLSDRTYIGEGAEGNEYILRFPLMHHRHDVTRMISAQSHAGVKKFTHQGRGNVLNPTSVVRLLSYDATRNTSIVCVMIHQGVRHQIRVHLATLGNPIIGDVLYGKGEEGLLQLVSCGMRVVA